MSLPILLLVLLHCLVVAEYGRLGDVLLDLLRGKRRVQGVVRKVISCLANSLKVLVLPLGDLPKRIRNCDSLQKAGKRTNWAKEFFRETGIRDSMTEGCAKSMFSKTSSEDCCASIRLSVEVSNHLIPITETNGLRLCHTLPDCSIEA